MASPNIATSVDITKTHTLLAMLDAIYTAPTFLSDTYFPTNGASDIFNTAKVFIDYKDGNRKIAPYVSKGSKDSSRGVFYTDELEPARIAPSRPLNMDELKRRGYGEAVFSSATEAERAAALTMEDFADLENRIKRTVEKMSADCMLANKYTMHYEDTDEDVTIGFDDTDTQGGTIYKPAATWSNAGANIFGDLANLITMLRRKGCKASDLITGSNSGSALMNNEAIIKMLDNRRYELGQFQPVLEDSGAAVLGMLNVNGVMIRIIQYTEEYEKDDGTLVPFFDPDSVVMTAPGAGRTLYGSVTQIDEQGGLPNTYAEKYVPKYISSVEDDIRKFILSSKPLAVPNRKGCWASSKVIFTA